MGDGGGGGGCLGEWGHWETGVPANSTYYPRPGGMGTTLGDGSQPTALATPGLLPPLTAAWACHSPAWGAWFSLPQCAGLLPWLEGSDLGAQGRASLGCGNSGNLGIQWPLSSTAASLTGTSGERAWGHRTGGGARNISSKCLYHLTLPLGLSNAPRRFPFWLPCWQGREAPGVAATCLAAGQEGGQDEGSTVRQTQQGEAPGANSPSRALAKMSPLLFCGPCIFPVPHPVESRLFLSLLAVCLAHHTSSPRRPGLWLPAVGAALGQPWGSAR